jgi:hypothetical protein
MLECGNVGMWDYGPLTGEWRGRRIGGLEKAGIDFTGGHRERRGRLRDGVKLETKGKPRAEI